MNIKLVTWDGDLTQFLVEAETNLDAIWKAIEANLKLGDCDGTDSDIHDSTTYSVEDVDFKLLGELFNRKDFSFIIFSSLGEVAVFGY